MLRRAFLVAAVAALLAAQTGCRSQCGERHSWFSSRSRAETPCQTVGRNTGCFDAATGAPVPCPTGTPTTVIPGGAYPMGPTVPGVGGRPIEVGPMPNLNENDLIRPQAVPQVAPPPNNTLLPFPALPGTPVKGGSNK